MMKRGSSDASLRHREQRTHLLLHDGRLVEHRDRDAVTLADVLLPRWQAPSA